MGIMGGAKENGVVFTCRIDHRQVNMAGVPINEH